MAQIEHEEEISVACQGGREAAEIGNFVLEAGDDKFLRGSKPLHNSQTRQRYSSHKSIDLTQLVGNGTALADGDVDDDHGDDEGALSLV